MSDATVSAVAMGITFGNIAIMFFNLVGMMTKYAPPKWWIYVFVIVPITWSLGIYWMLKVLT